MEPFSKSATQSAGQSALDALFPSAPAGKGTPAPAGAADTPPAPEPEPQVPSSDVGDYGSLGDLPPDAAQPEAGAGEEAAPAAATADANFFEFSVTDGDGRRKVKVDLNNKEALARILPQAYGFRKMQVERDKANAKLKEVEPRLTELETQWQALERTYQEGGVEGLVDMLGGKKGHYREFLNSEIQRDARYKSATQAEKERMDLEERVAKMQRDSELREKRAAEEATKAKSEREAAELSNLESQLVPAFNKYRFAGQLGNESQEQAFDQAVWNQAIANLEKLPDDQPLTSALIEKEFKTVAMAFRAAIGKQADAKTKKVLESKKQAAQTQVAAAATRAMSKPGAAEQSMAANIKKGGVGGLTAGLLDALRMR